MLELKIVRIPDEPAPGALSIPLSVTDYVNSARGKARLRRATAMLLLRDTLMGVGVNSFDIDVLPSGKPILRSSGLHFSISYAGGLCALALSDSPVGIDLQDTDAAEKISNRASFARRFFAPDEYEVFMDEPTVCQLCRIWTRKEALAKLLGRPLNTSLSSLSSLNCPDINFETRRASLEKEFFLTVATKQKNKGANHGKDQP